MNKLTAVWNLIPHSKARNSDELIDELAALVLDEPRTLYMPLFVSNYLPTENEDIYRGPACGFVGCFAGWICALKAPNVRRLDSDGSNTEGQALNFLPHACRWDADDLFMGKGDYPFPEEAQYGTTEYADAAVANLRAFQGRWKKELLAHQLTPTKVERTE